MTIKNTDNQQSPGSAAQKLKPDTRPSFQAVLVLLGILLLELVLPVMVSGVVIWYLFASYSLWQYDLTWMSISFGVAVTIIALMLSVLIDRLLETIRKSHYARGLNIGKNANARMIKMGMAGLVIPIALLIAANQVVFLSPLSPKPSSVMAYLISVSTQPVVSAPPAVIGQLAIESQDAATKILSIQVLQGFRSPDAQAQLLRIVREDPMALQDGGVRTALQKAIAAYGAASKEPLLVLFKSIPPDQGSAPGLSSDLYERYFSLSFEGLQQEITNATPDEQERQDRLVQLEAAQVQLKQTLSSIQDTQPASGDLRLDFILQTLMAMDIKQDDDLLTFAKTTAGDALYSSLVRGDALLLLAALGSQQETEALYPYLKSEDLFLRTRALQAIVILQQKSGAVQPTQ